MFDLNGNKLAKQIWCAQFSSAKVINIDFGAKKNSRYKFLLETAYAVKNGIIYACFFLWNDVCLSITIDVFIFSLNVLRYLIHINGFKEEKKHG